MDQETGTPITNGVSLQDVHFVNRPTVIFAIKRLAKLLSLAPISYLEFLARKGGARALKQDIMSLARTNTLLAALGASNPHRITKKAITLRHSAHSVSPGIMFTYDFGKPIYATWLHQEVGNAIPQSRLKDPQVAGCIIEAIMGLCQLCVENRQAEPLPSLTTLSTAAAHGIWE